MLQRRGFFVLPLLAFLWLGACDDGSEPPTVSGGTKPGLGASTARPTGEPYALPAGISFAMEPRGYAFVDDARCPDFRDTEIEGGGGTVTLCLAFGNSTDAPIEVVLPPGLIFISKSVDVQNGLLLERVAVLVPAHTVVDVVVAAYCANAFRHVPDPEDGYELGPITDDPDLLELIGLLEGLDLPGTAIGATEAESAAITRVQAAVWEVTDEGRLSAGTRAELEQLVP